MASRQAAGAAARDDLRQQNWLRNRQRLRDSCDSCGLCRTRLRLRSQPRSRTRLQLRCCEPHRLQAAQAARADGLRLLYQRYPTSNAGVVGFEFFRESLIPLSLPKPCLRQNLVSVRTTSPPKTTLRAQKQCSMMRKNCFARGEFCQKRLAARMSRQSVGLKPYVSISAQTVSLA